MFIRVTCSLYIEISSPTPLILMLRPRSTEQQRIVHESYSVTPDVPATEFEDIFGNLCQRLVAPAGEFRVVSSADVLTMSEPVNSPGSYFTNIQDLPEIVLMYLLPSRYCESDRFGQMANEIVSGAQPGYDQVVRVRNWISKSIKYLPGSSEFPESATEVNAKGFGVCRDLAHLGIALCRGINIPARLAVGFLYGLKPMDLHAWFEAYVGGCWQVFDPVQKHVRGDRVITGHGRDSADVAIYNLFGEPPGSTALDVNVELLEN